jgi:hypothetical protein
MASDFHTDRTAEPPPAATDAQYPVHATALLCAEAQADMMRVCHDVMQGFSRRAQELGRCNLALFDALTQARAPGDIHTAIYRWVSESAQLSATETSLALRRLSGLAEEWMQRGGRHVATPIGAMEPMASAAFGALRRQTEQANAAAAAVAAQAERYVEAGLDRAEEAEEQVAQAVEQTAAPADSARKPSRRGG